MVERGDAQVEGDGAPEGDADGGDLGAPVAGVGDDDHVGVELVAVRLEEGRERARAELLLPLDEQRRSRGPGRRRPRCSARMAFRCVDDAGLVVRGSAAVETVAAQGRLERQGLPVARRRRAAARRGARRAARSGGRCAPGGCATTAGLAERGAAGDRAAARPRRSSKTPSPRSQLGHPLGAGAHVGVVESVPRHRGDAHQTGQLGDRGRESRRHRLAELVGERGRIGGRCHVGYLKQSTTARTPRGQDPRIRQPAAADAGGDSAQEQAAQGKSAPTPTRREQEAARKRPLVPTDRKQASRDSRGQVNAARERARAGMAAGEEKYLPVRDKGPQKRYVRDYVDARTSVGEILLPLLVHRRRDLFPPVDRRDRPDRGLDRHRRGDRRLRHSRIPGAQAGSPRNSARARWSAACAGTRPCARSRSGRCACPRRRPSAGSTRARRPRDCCASPG